MGFDYNQFRKFAKDFGKIEQEYTKFIQRFLTDQALKVLRRTVMKTPVDEGTLRNAWQVSKVFRRGNDFYIIVYNLMEYASFVEDGHRQSKRWVPGKWNGKRFSYIQGSDEGMMLKNKWIKGVHMARIAITEVEMQLPKAYNAAFNKWVRTMNMA